MFKTGGVFFHSFHTGKASRFCPEIFHTFYKVLNITL